MKRSTTLLLPVLLLVMASCGTTAQYSQQRFQDEIYAKIGEEPEVVRLLSQKDFENKAAANIAHKQGRDTLVIILDDPWDVAWYSRYNRYHYSPWLWGGLAFGCHYWNRYYGSWYDPFWDNWYGYYGGWYDPWYYSYFDPWYYDPWYGGYGYGWYGHRYGWYDHPSYPGGAGRTTVTARPDLPAAPSFAAGPTSGRRAEHAPPRARLRPPATPALPHPAALRRSVPASRATTLPARIRIRTATAATPRAAAPTTTQPAAPPGAALRAALTAAVRPAAVRRAAPTAAPPGAPAAPTAAVRPAAAAVVAALRTAAATPRTAAVAAVPAAADAGNRDSGSSPE